MYAISETECVTCKLTHSKYGQPEVSQDLIIRWW